MQLTSTPEEDRSLRRRTPSPWPALNRPVAPAVIAFVGWLGFALARWQVWAKGHLSLFIMAGHTYTHRAQLPRGVLLVPSAGYDGQFYYRLALDPVNWNRTAFGITMDQSYRYTRIGYPILAWLVSLGQHQFVPVALVAINLIAVAAMAFLGGMFAREPAATPCGDWPSRHTSAWSSAWAGIRPSRSPRRACWVACSPTGGTGRCWLPRRSRWAPSPGRPSCSPRPRSRSPGWWPWAAGGPGPAWPT